METTSPNVTPNGTLKTTLLPERNNSPKERVWTPERAIVFSEVGRSSSIDRSLGPSNAQRTSKQDLEIPYPSPLRRVVSTPPSNVSNKSESVSGAPPIPASPSPRTYAGSRGPPEAQRAGDFSSARAGSTNNTQVKSVRPIKETVNFISPPLQSLFNVIVAAYNFLQRCIAACLTLPPSSFAATRSSIASILPAWIWSPLPQSPATQSRRTYWTYKTEQTSKSTPRVRVCTDLATSDSVAALFLDAEVVGFDLEWQAGASTSSGIKSNVSVIQVAKHDLIALFHLARFPGSDRADLLVPNLQRLIESPDILKTGVNIAGDCSRLRRHLGIEAQGIIELSGTYRLVKYSESGVDDIKKINKTLVPLATQVEEHLGLPLFKETDVRTSDWSKELSPKQTLYAASDAYACLRLWQVLDAKRAALDPPPPRPALHELKLPIRLANGQTVAEYLAAQKVDAEVVAEVVQRDSDIEEEFSSSDSDDGISVEFDDSESDGEDVAEVAGTELSSAATSPTAPLSDTVAFERAAEWATTALASLSARPLTSSSNLLPSKRQLQAYHLYYEQKATLGKVAGILSIKPSSAACYILEAIQTAKLPYDEKKLEQQVIPKVPRQAKGRFWKFIK